MDGTQFDDLAQRLAQTRITRLDALRGLVASAVVGLTAVSLTTDESEAKKKGKARKARKQKKGGKGNGRNGNGGGNGGANGNGGGNGNGNGGNGNGGNGNEEKFLICHCPPGNPDNCHTISVGSQSAVNAHLAHGDTEGACEDTSVPVCDEELPEGCEYLPEDEQTDPEGCLFECTSATLNFGPNGWGGWSCPAGTTVVSGRHDLEDAAISKAANPDDPDYPTYPHYTFDEAAGEEGWVVQNDNDSEPERTIWVTCLAA